MLFVCIAGAVIGAAPLALAFRARWLFVCFTLAVALFTAFSLLKSIPVGGPAPSRTLLEYVLASVSASLMFRGFLTGGAIVAVSLYWIVILLNLLLWAIGVAVTFPAAKIAWAVGWLFSALAWLLMTFLSIDEVREQLFPGAHSRFHELATVHRYKSLLELPRFYASRLALRWPGGNLSGRLGRSFWLVIDFYLIFIAALLQPSDKRSSIERSQIYQFSQTFQKLGWAVAREPRTDDYEIDPLLSGLDIVTSDGSHVWGVHFKSEAKNPSIGAKPPR